MAMFKGQNKMSLAKSGFLTLILRVDIKMHSSSGFFYHESIADSPEQKSKYSLSLMLVQLKIFCALLGSSSVASLVETWLIVFKK